MCVALYSNPSAAGGVVEKSFDVEAFMSQAVTLQEGGKVLNLKIQSNWVQSAFQANGFGTSDYRTGGNLLRVRWKVKYKARQRRPINSGSKIRF